MDFILLKMSGKFSISLKSVRETANHPFNYSYPITESCNWMVVIGHPCFPLSISYEIDIGTWMTIHYREFCFDRIVIIIYAINHLVQPHF